MMVDKIPESRELRVRDFPVKLHRKVERYISLIHARTGRELTKQTAIVELVDKATRNIKLIEAA